MNKLKKKLLSRSDRVRRLFLFADRGRRGLGRERKCARIGVSSKTDYTAHVGGVRRDVFRTYLLYGTTITPRKRYYFVLNVVVMSSRDNSGRNLRSTCFFQRSWERPSLYVRVDINNCGAFWVWGFPFFFHCRRNNVLACTLIHREQSVVLIIINNNILYRCVIAAFSSRACTDFDDNDY